MIRGLLSILLLSRGLLMKSLAFLLLFSFLAVSSFAAPQSAAPESTPPSSPPTDERLDRILRSLEALRQTSEKQTKQTLTSMEEAKIRIDTITDRNIGWVNMGYAALAAFAALLALAGVGITYFTTQSAQEQVKRKKEAFEKYEKEIKELLERSRNHEANLSKMLHHHGFSEKVTTDIKEQAQEAVKSGKGIEVLWGKAILAQENEQWEKAYTFWKTILEDSPRNENALFGLAVACGNLARESSKNTTEKKNLLEEGIHNLKKISDAMQNPNVLCNWGTLLFTRAAAASSPEAKNAFWDDAQEKYRRATKENEHLADAWSNWGALLSARADAATSPEEKNAFWDDAQEKYRRATEEDEHHAAAWYSWGALLSARADAASSPEEKNALWDEAETKYIQSSSIEPALPAYNQACLAALRNGPLENILHYLNISLKGEELPSLRHMQDDPDLDSIRDTPEFKAFIEKVRALDRPIDKE